MRLFQHKSYLPLVETDCPCFVGGECRVTKEVGSFAPGQCAATTKKQVSFVAPEKWAGNGDGGGAAEM